MRKSETEENICKRMESPWEQMLKQINAPRRADKPSTGQIVETRRERLEHLLDSLRVEEHQSPS